MLCGLEKGSLLLNDGKTGFRLCGNMNLHQPTDPMRIVVEHIRSFFRANAFL